ncbi:arginine N-succinyltransferase [Sphingomonadaceae bacterium jetA1]|uniref:arginine N-succinyltransferase n=1 Tax=Facivitalis istanbulensis TaxID=3075838 RepID=UPI003482C2B0
MTIVLRAAGGHDLSALYDMARTTGGGFVNLPPDEAKLGQRLAAADAAFARDTDSFGVDRFLFVLENSATRAIHGTCQIFSHIGTDAPFYSYRIDRHGADHGVLGRSVDHTTLTICTDHAGCSEVGGLFLRADARAGGAGTLLARSRYLFIAMHRRRFADRTIAELRGVVDDAGEAPFWDGIAARFFGMGFAAADAFNAEHGTHVLAGLMPTTPVLLAMLPESARAVLGVPHPSGRPALRLLEKEGFRHDHYVDLFDGGPTVTAATDDIATIRTARSAVVRAVGHSDTAMPSIAAAGRLAGFRACFAQIAAQDDGVLLDPDAAHRLGVGIGDPITFAPR